MAEDRSRWRVLVPFHDRVEHATEQVLDELERRGIDVWRLAGCSAIDFCRNWMATDSLMHPRGIEKMLFVDGDMLFHPDSAEYILSRDEPIVCGAYAQKFRSPDGVLKINTKFVVDREMDVAFGVHGGDYPVVGCGAGFLRIASDALRRMVAALGLPLCNANNIPAYPFFLPFLSQQPDGSWLYNGEDYAFCLRATMAGIPVIADTRIHLKHLGSYGYDWDDLSTVAPPHSETRILTVKPAL